MTTALLLSSCISQTQKESCDRDNVWISDLNYQFTIDFKRSTPDIQTTFKKLVRNTPLHVVNFNSLLCVWKCSQTRRFAFDKLLTYLVTYEWWANISSWNKPVTGAFAVVLGGTEKKKIKTLHVNDKTSFVFFLKKKKK